MVCRPRWSCSDTLLFEPGFDVDPAEPDGTALASPRARESYHHDGRHCPRRAYLRGPRNARLIMSSVIPMFMVRSKDFRQRPPLSRLSVRGRHQYFAPPSIAKAMIASSKGACACVFSCDLIFTSKLFGLSDTSLAHSFCIADGSPNKQQL